jgi:hypothetical protein
VRRRGEQTDASSTLLHLRARHLRDELPDDWFAEKGLGPRAAHEIRLAICRWTELSPSDQEVIEKILDRGHDGPHGGPTPRWTGVRHPPAHPGCP